MKRVFSVLALLATLAVGCQAFGYTLSLSPITQDIGLGDSATVKVSLALEGQEVLNGFDFTLGFRSDILSLTNFASPSIPLTSVTSNPSEFSGLYDNYFGGFTYLPNINPDTIGFNGFFPLEPLSPLDGNFILAALTFTGVNWGTSPLTLTGEMDLGTGTDFSINEGASVNVVPEPGTCLLMGLGLAGFIGFRKKFAVN